MCGSPQTQYLMTIKMNLIYSLSCSWCHWWWNRLFINYLELPPWMLIKKIVKKIKNPITKIQRIKSLKIKN